MFTISEDLYNVKISFESEVKRFYQGKRIQEALKKEWELRKAKSRISSTMESQRLQFTSKT